MSVKLFNQGQREIQYGKDSEGNDLVLKPKAVMDFDNATAAMLRRLYSDEVLDLETVSKAFEEKPVVTAAVDPVVVAPVTDKPMTPEREKELVSMATDYEENDDGTVTYTGKDENGKDFAVTVKA